MPTVHDTCPCGAQFYADGLTAGSVHKDWLATHDGCRRGWLESLGPPAPVVGIGSRSADRRPEPTG